MQVASGHCKDTSPDHTSTLDTVHNLGLLYNLQGKLDDAEKMYQRALQGKEKAWGSDHTSTFDTVNNLSILYKSQGKLQTRPRRCTSGHSKDMRNHRTQIIHQHLTRSTFAVEIVVLSIVVVIGILGRTGRIIAACYELGCGSFAKVSCRSPPPELHLPVHSASATHFTASSSEIMPLAIASVKRVCPTAIS
jgi:Tetratricopeptide repeat